VKATTYLLVAAVAIPFLGFAAADCFSYAIPMDSTKLSIVSPERFGRRINRVPRQDEKPSAAYPWKKTKDGVWYYTPEMWKGGQELGYPSVSCPMSFMVFSDDKKSILVTAGDSPAQAAQPFVEYDPKSAKVSVRWQTIEVGGAVRPLACKAREFAGDWHAAVTAYRDEWRRGRGIAPHPQYVADSPSMLLVILKQQNGEIIWPYTEFDRLADTCARLGVDYVGLFGWTKDGHDNFYPDYEPDPKMGGRSALVNGIELLRKRGIRTFLYANGQLQERGKTEYWKLDGNRAAQVDKSGSHYGETWHKYSDAPAHYFDLGCLSDLSWKNRMRGLAWQAHALGSDGILYDQLGIGGPRPCFATTHGHVRGAIVYSEERTKFLKDIADEMHTVDRDFIVLTEGFHDTILDSCAAFHGWGAGQSLAAADEFASRGTGMSDWMPEVARYAFPELQVTMRVPTPIVTRSAVNYAALYGYKHELEVRYTPDRAYLEKGVKPKLADYGTVRQKPALDTMLKTDPNVAGAYLKQVADFQRRHRNFLLRGRFLDNVGVELGGDSKSVAATRWLADDGRVAVLVWNASSEPRHLELKVDGVKWASAVLPLAANSLRLYTVEGSYDCEYQSWQVRGPEAWLEFMGGNVRKDGLRCDLEAMRAAGISGVHFFHIDRKLAWPECPEQIPCMSEKWNDIVSFLGSECRRLGLKLTVQNCPGWSQSGGPWVDLDHCQRHLRMARRDFSEGETYRLPEVPKKFSDRDSDWRDVAVLAFPTPEGDSEDSILKPQRIEKDGTTRVFHFAEPVTVRSLILPGIDTYNPKFSYEMPWMRVSLEVKDANGWREVVRSPLPVSSWRDYVETFTLACGETKGKVWRFKFEHDRPIVKFGEPQLSSAPRQTDWEGKSARTLRSLLPSPPPPQSRAAWVEKAKVIDITGKSDWKVPAGRWTVLRLGSVNAKYVNSPAPKEATGWECDKLDPSGIEANFNGYIRKLAEGPLRGKMSGFLVDSWECYGQTWTAKMEKYFQDANGFAVRPYLPALFGWIVDSPEKTEEFLTVWRRTIGDLITKNYYGHMADLARASGLTVLYETAFGDIIHGDLLEYWKYADEPMCEFWFPHDSRDEGLVGTYAFKPIMPCASAAHIYGKRRVTAEAFTGWNITWKENFRDLRDVANRHFAKGVTHLAFQSYTHAPAPNALPPGACMGGYNGTPFTRLQTWWKHMPEFTGWLRDCERLLEEGRPINDVLWYLGDAVDHKPDEYFAFPEGYKADYLNYDVLVNRLTVKDGRFTIPEGTSWRVLWVPDTRFMRPATKAKLSELAAQGGRVVYGDKKELKKALAGFEKDVSLAPALGDEPSEDFMWIHRKVKAVDRYFVAAGTNGYSGKVTFREKGPVTVYDPVSRRRWSWVNGSELALAPSQSVFVEFGGMDGSRASGSLPLHAKGPARQLAGPWKLSFTPGWDAPESVTLDKLVPWCDIPAFSEAARTYSGTVVYETSFDAVKVSSLLLDLGRVEDIAAVYLNGKKVRTLWCEPYVCDLSGFVREGKNDLRIEVTGTWHNRVFYDQTIPEKDRKTWTVYVKPPRKDILSKLIPQGLLGPVKLAKRGELSAVVIDKDRGFGPLHPSVKPSAKEYLWPEGKMPLHQPHQIAEKYALAESKGFEPDKHRRPYIEWYEPNSSNKTDTCVLVISGGGFNICCDAARLQPIIDRLVMSGVTVANLTYRTPRPCGLPIYQSALADAQRAVRILRSQAKRRGYSPDRIGATGISAGAKAVLLLALSSETPAYERVDELDDLPACLQFAAPQAPAYTLVDGALGENIGRGVGSEIAPELKFDEKSCPLCFVQGAADVFSPLGAMRIWERMREKGIVADLHLFANRWHGVHGDGNRRADGTGWDHWCDRILEFISRFEPKLRAERYVWNLSPDEESAAKSRLGAAKCPQVFIAGSDDDQSSTLKAWYECWLNGDQRDLHLESRPLTDTKKLSRRMEFANHLKGNCHED